MSFRRALTSGFIFVFMLAPVSSWAVTSSLWEEDTKEAFEAGEPEDISIMEPGKIMLGPKAKETTLDARYSWSVTEDSKGRAYAGTGNEGKIFRISREGEAEIFADLELQQLFALAIDADDTLYASGFPGGKIYSISPGGDIQEYFDTGQNSVWALYTGGDGVLYAGTGDNGEIYAVRKQGDGKLLYDSSQARILSLTGDAEGNLYAGTDQTGIIYKIDEGRRVSVLYDTELEEITSMTVDAAGNLYAVSAPGSLFMKIPPPQTAPLVPKMVQGAAAAAMAAESAADAQPPAMMPGMPAIPSPKKRTCMIYKIGKDGAASKFWTSPETLIFSLAFAGEDLLAGSGDEAIIYMISPAGEAGTYYKGNQKQALALCRSRSGAIIATFGNDAAVVRFAEGHSAKGTFTSQVHDAKTASKWGRIFWEADVPPQTQISLSTRSGNSEAPDDMWSEWSGGETRNSGFTSKSPGGRYIQWRATLSTEDAAKTPALRKVTVAYIQANLPPAVQSLGVGGGAGNGKAAPGPADLAAAFKAMASGNAGGSGQEGNAKAKVTQEGVKTAAAAHETKLKIQWQAEDPNDDELEYNLFFKGVEQSRWMPLKDDLEETSYEWDTDAVPDGEYLIRVVATDLPSNPAKTALNAQRTSEPFTIDNTPPAVEVVRAARSGESARYRISATVSDNISPVSSADYSIDGGDWMTVFPKDGIFDSLFEEIEFTVGPLEKGEHTIALKAIDYFGNIGAGKMTFTAK